MRIRGICRCVIFRVPNNKKHPKSQGFTAAVDVKQKSPNELKTKPKPILKTGETLTLSGCVKQILLYNTIQRYERHNWIV